MCKNLNFLEFSVISGMNVQTILHVHTCVITQREVTIVPVPMVTECQEQTVLVGLTIYTLFMASILK